MRRRIQQRRGGFPQVVEHTSLGRIGHSYVPVLSNIVEKDRHGLD
jgi:hypothetical protein